MADYTAYIDEAGDLGFGRGTKWFVLTAVIVKKTDEKAIREKMNAIKSRLNIREIHIRKVTDFNKRAFIVRELSEEEFTYMNILVDTQQLNQNLIPDPLIAYNYVCKYLLQRVSWFMDGKDAQCDVVLSARGTSRDNELIEYISDKLLPYPSNSINQKRFNKISAKTAATWDLLQLADVCATSTFLAYEINGWGFSVPCYSTMLSKHLYRKRSKLKSYGIKYFTALMEPDLEVLAQTKMCAKKERTPGATTT